MTTESPAPAIADTQAVDEKAIAEAYYAKLKEQAAKGNSSALLNFIGGVNRSA